MEITLKPEQAEFIQAQIMRGRYENVEAVVNRALQLLQDWEQEYEQWLAETRQKVEVGLAQAEQGDVLDIDVVTDRLRAKLLNARESQA
jgi:antitoxin ParD1/3/4